MGFPPVFTDAWDITQPPDTQLASLLGQDIRNLKLDIMQRMSLLSGTFANRPTPETANATWGGTGFGLLYFSTDTHQIFQWSGSAWVDITSNIALGSVKSEGNNVTPVTVANTTVLSPLQTLTVPANDIIVGSKFVTEALGIIGIVGGGGQSITVGVFLDAIQIGSLPMNLAAANTQPWKLRATFAGLTTGTIGTVTGCYMEWMSSPSGGGFAINTTGVGSPPQTVTIDTTVQHTLQIQVQWGSANVSNTITSQFMDCARFS